MNNLIVSRYLTLNNKLWIYNFNSDAKVYKITYCLIQNWTNNTKKITIVLPIPVRTNVTDATTVNKDFNDFNSINFTLYFCNKVVISLNKLLIIVQFIVNVLGICSLIIILFEWNIAETVVFDMYRGYPIQINFY